MIKKIWKDSVGSRIIAWLFILILTAAGMKAKSWFDETSFSEIFQYIINLEIRLIYVLAFIFVYSIVSKLLSTKEIIDEDEVEYGKEDILRKFNKLEDSEKNILIKWNVHFDLSGNPFISDLTFFCTNHGEVPVRYIFDYCNVNGCKNARKKLNKYDVENGIESMVLHEWDKLNNN